MAGASAAATLPASALVVEERFAALCAAPKPCPSYGLAPGCPPHAMSPRDFRHSLDQYDQALVFRIDAPGHVVLGAGRLAVARGIHQLAGLLEQKALDLGCTRTQALACGSCKELFCADQICCVVLEYGLPCLHKDEARPSLSAMGIDFAALAKLLHWPLVWPAQAEEDGGQQMAMLAGLLLVAWH